MQFSLTLYESENFCDSSLHHILESENFRFPFSTLNSVNWLVKYEQIFYRKQSLGASFVHDSLVVSFA